MKVKPLTNAQRKTLRFSDLEPPAPSAKGESAQGWRAFLNSLRQYNNGPRPQDAVKPGWTSSYAHGDVEYKGNGSQGWDPVLATRLDALVQLRLDVERRAALDLYAIDLEIKREKRARKETTP